MTVPAVKLEPFFEDLLKEAGHIDFAELPVEEIRRLRGAAFTSEGDLPEVLEEDKVIQRQGGKTIEITITRPPNTEKEVLPVLFYIHGGGWVNCNKYTHQKLRYELTDRTRGAVIFVNYTLSPEVRYPYALEECYDALAWVAVPANAASINVDPNKIIIGGESAGGNLAAALCFLAKQRGLLSAIKYQVLLYPATNAEFDTGSYDQFAKGYFLDRKLMQLYWDLYCPEKERRKEITASPLQASIDDLKGLPPACVLTCEADVLRDEGEAYGRKLREAGVPVVSFRLHGVIHGCFNVPTVTLTSAAALDLVVSLVEKAWSAL